MRRFDYSEEPAAVQGAAHYDAIDKYRPSPSGAAEARHLRPDWDYEDNDPRDVTGLAW